MRTNRVRRENEASQLITAQLVRFETALAQFDTINQRSRISQFHRRLSYVFIKTWDASSSIAGVDDSNETKSACRKKMVFFLRSADSTSVSCVRADRELCVTIFFLFLFLGYYCSRYLIFSTRCVAASDDSREISPWELIAKTRRRSTNFLAAALIFRVSLVFDLVSLFRRGAFFRVISSCLPASSAFIFHFGASRDHRHHHLNTSFIFLFMVALFRTATRHFMMEILNFSFQIFWGRRKVS